MKRKEVTTPKLKKDGTLAKKRGPKPKPKSILPGIDELIRGVQSGLSIEDYPGIDDETIKKVKAEVRKRWKSIDREALIAIAQAELAKAIEDREHGSTVKLIKLLDEMRTAVSKPAPLKFDLTSIDGCAKARRDVADAIAARTINVGEAQTLSILIAGAEGNLRTDPGTAKDTRPVESENDARARIEAAMLRVVN